MILIDGIHTPGCSKRRYSIKLRYDMSTCPLQVFWLAEVDAYVCFF